MIFNTFIFSFKLTKYKNRVAVEYFNKIYGVYIIKGSFHRYLQNNVDVIIDESIYLKRIITVSGIFKHTRSYNKMYFDTFITMVNQNYAKTVGIELYITVLLLVANIVKEIFFFISIKYVTTWRCPRPLRRMDGQQVTHQKTLKI